MAQDLGSDAWHYWGRGTECLLPIERFTDLHLVFGSDDSDDDGSGASSGSVNSDDEDGSDDDDGESDEDDEGGVGGRGGDSSGEEVANFRTPKADGNKVFVCARVRTRMQSDVHKQTQIYNIRWNMYSSHLKMQFAST